MFFQKIFFSFDVDNQLIQTISQTQNRAAKDKKASSTEVQSLWTPLTQLGEQLTLALVFNSQSIFDPIKTILFLYLEIIKSTKTRRTIIT